MRLGREFPSKPTQFKLIDQAEWELLPHGERVEHLAVYYLAVRAEDLSLDTEGREADKTGQYTAWLDSPVAKVIALSAALTSLADLAIKGWEVLRLHGLGGGPSDEGESVDHDDDRVHYVL